MLKMWHPKGMRITTSSPGFTALPPRAGASSQELKAMDAPGELQTVLFGSQLPKIVDAGSYPQLAEQLAWLRRHKTKLAAFVGDQDSDYDVALAEGLAACIDRNGTIYIGVALLALATPELMLGVLAHEVGHRPKTWQSYRRKEPFTRAELLQMARDEEAKADRVAGRAIAEFQITPDDLCEFLRVHGNFEKPPENYYPVAVRIAMIRQAFASGQARGNAAKKLFPQFEKETSARNLIHTGEDPLPRNKRRLIRSV